VWTQNQLNLPVDRPVIVHLSSKDVIHSFGLPQMRVKQDAIPGVEQRLWFTPTKTGEWEIVCSQLCGLGHYRMRGFYTIQTQADFNAWLASQPRWTLTLFNLMKPRFTSIHACVLPARMRLLDESTFLQRFQTFPARSRG
jgi:cytochrome c oxidase subunit II